MRTIYCLILLLCPYISLCQALTIGDKVPDIPFSQMVNHTSQTSSLYRFKAKLIILDFWATWCSACLKKFPLLDSLKLQHNNNLQVLLISNAGNGDTKEKITGLFSKMAVAHGSPLTLPVALSDSVTGKLFPHIHLPHYAWLDSNFKVIAITGAGEITAYNINAAINGHIPQLAFKEDMDDFNPAIPLFINGNGGSGSQLTFRSTLAKYIPGIASVNAVNKDTAGHITRLLFANTTVLQLLQYAYRPGLKQNRFRYRFAGSSNIITAGKTGIWIAQNSYTYELMLPPSTDSLVYHCIQQDLIRYFSLAAKTEILPTPCYILTADTAILENYICSSGKPVNELYESAFRKMHNRPISTLSAFLNSKLPLPVVDETGFSQNLSITLPEINITDILALKQALKVYGLGLTPATRMLSNFIIYQTN